MGDPVLTTSATVTCPHGGQGTISPNQTAASAGSVICTKNDQVTIAGCPFMIGNSPSPCMSVQWNTSSTTSTAGGAAVLTVSSVGLCMSAANAPQGPVVLIPAQTQVMAT